MSKKIYLAIPFSGIEDYSYNCANEIASLLIAEGNTVFSPISHAVPIGKTNMADHSYDAWMAQDKVFVDWADEVYVAVLKGDGTTEWGFEKIRNSTGVQMEQGWANDSTKPLTYVAYSPKERTLEYLPTPAAALV